MRLAVNITVSAYGAGMTPTGNWYSTMQAITRRDIGCERMSPACRPMPISVCGNVASSLATQGGASINSGWMSITNDGKAKSGGLFGWLKGLAKGVLGAASNILGQLPIVGNVFGALNGLAKGNLEQVVRALPIVGNVYDAAKGLFSGQFGKALEALSGFIPFVGSALQLAGGLRSGSLSDLLGGVAGLALDFATLGQSRFLTGRATANFARLWP